MQPLERELANLRTLAPELRYHGEEAFGQWQHTARLRLAELVGLPRFCETPPETRIESEARYGTHREIRFTFESEPGYRVPCVLCLPLSPVRPRPPLMICLQGHTTGMHLSLGRTKYREDLDPAEREDREIALQCIARGFAALTLEQRCFGEKGGTPMPDCYRTAMAAILAGRTVIGARVWDVMRAIDAAAARFSEAFDANKIWCMGNSGGGTATLYAAALEPRIAGAVCSCAFCAFEPSIVENRHCACNYVPHIRRYFDMSEIAALVAPRPLVIVNGSEDVIFPLAGAKEAFGRLAAYYRAAGAAENCRHVIGQGGHRFYAAPAWEAFLSLAE